ncbi:RTX toxin [Neorhizobium sp. T25_13]|uniref:RTX toxin n=1 Tax=Neorhizobium sp. T25_13 TaxID=2093830 RepID=UPI001FE1233E|nr:RTX toxin [Neorhizobium sp. T25_13]
MPEDRAITSITNAFYRNSNAASYASLLFSGPSVSAGQSSGSAQGIGPASAGGIEPDTQGPAQRALARIVEILALGKGDDSSEVSVSESLGYITHASGSEGDDSLTMTGRAVYDVESGAGDDTLMVKTASLSGLYAGDGADKVQAKADLLRGIDGGAGKDDIQLAGKLAMDVSGGGDADSIRISAETMTGIDGGDGDDILYLEGRRIFASGGAGNDTVTIHQTGKPAGKGVVEYTFGKNGGQDTIATDGPISLRFDGYFEKDVSISIKDNVLTASFESSDDKITVTLDEKALKGGVLSYGFAFENGQTVLKIG